MIRLYNPVFPRAAPFATYVLFIVLASSMESGKVIEDLRWLYGVKVAFVAGLLAFFWRSYDELRSSISIPAKDWFGTIVVGLVVFVLWINLDHSWITLGAATGFNPTDAQGNLNIPLVITRWIGAALIVPIMEELFWRSFLLRWLQNANFLSVKPQQVTIKISFITALMFGFGHNLWFAGLITGLIYNWLYIRTGNLWVPIVAHAVTNGALGIWVVATGNWQFW